MDVRFASNPLDVNNFTTLRLREEFLIQSLFSPGMMNMVYSHSDRIIIGGTCPIQPIKLAGGEEIKAMFFLERREMGIVNIGSKGTVIVDGAAYELDRNDSLYIGMGNRDVTFTSDDTDNPAKFYFNSTPAHKTYPTVKINIKEAEPAKMGTQALSNERTIYKYIHPQGVKSCQLVMGMTILETGSVWNTMPCHTHDRRMEVYLYFNLPEDDIVFHNMGRPDETRHIIVRNEEAVISPSWSIHSGCGTHNYAFIWGMAGENQVFADIEGISNRDLK